MNDREQAGYEVSRAIKSGTLSRLDGTVLCVDCGSPATEYDHRNYKNTLAVQPVCRSCNKLRGPAIGWTPEPENAPPMNDVRIEMGLDVDDVARLAGISYFQAYRTLRGETKKPRIVKRIKDALKMGKGSP